MSHIHCKLHISYTRSSTHSLRMGDWEAEAVYCGWKLVWIWDYQTSLLGLNPVLLHFQMALANKFSSVLGLLNILLGSTPKGHHKQYICHDALGAPLGLCTVIGRFYDIGHTAYRVFQQAHKEELPHGKCVLPGLCSHTVDRDLSGQWDVRNSPGFSLSWASLLSRSGKRMGTTLGRGGKVALALVHISTALLPWLL